jgi:predicted nucleotidyltransferase
MPRKEKNSASSADLRLKVAREAAFLLYFGLEKEYKQAKVKASQNVGVHVLPSNLEIALELDQLAEENEGPARTQRLIAMRKEALAIMKALKAYCPLLIGSVWRGTIQRSSDIDISAYHDETQHIVNHLKKAGLKISKTERMTIAKHGKTEDSFHIYATTPTNYTVEVTVRNAEEAGKKRTCDTFGDEIKGLTLYELEKLLQANPTQRFLPN